ncbi:MBL fold metallo-hydrolase [Clostridium perfringens]|uniref:phage tail spike protein n=1 Tax=Clostridium perfringens TaxID=1502 RepID=UPI0010099F45|nr:phage tail spike protein [Clostridium perfringens]RXI81063.1 MBL fold metallo-hydrolase [Clostridium perfringens]RXI84770.1 MBL fold metallo-hydrolase [Clostridium perfringens]RXI86071.1 MBL fold metallo-hydrolase [Clostridium perfringens]RXI88157.1 MBL fold metallo-hydrolase [Clostridium perfringens]RXI91849.1 MBL fold metallo-hydrolase [Clostridium perfringens]
MINIYDSTETNFSHNGICSLDEKRELIKCTIHRKLEGAYEGTLFISKENLKWTEFIEGRILKLPVDINGRTQLFRIFDTSDDFTDLEVYFKHIFFDLDDFFIEDTNIVEKDGRGAINQILNTTVDSHRFTATSDINIINNCRIVDKTVTEAIGVDENCFLNRWGGEIDYDNFKFKINEKIGSDNGYRISLRKNLKAINGDISITEVATKLKIKGYDGIKLDEYLISPLANAYPHFKTRVVKFDDIKVKSDPDNPEEKGYETLQAAQLEMRRRGLELFSKQNIDKPTVNFEIDIDEMREENIEVGVLEVLSIGDIATLELEDFLRSNIEVKQRVIELEFDCIRKINIKVILGESTSTIFKEVSKIESILNDLNDKLEGNSWQDILDKSMEQATDIIAEGFKDSYVIPRKNEIIVADNIDLNLAKKVIVINKNGIGFSLEGYRPDRLTLAMTIDGEINASCIKFGSLSGALIDVGTIEADRLSVNAKKTLRDGLVKTVDFEVSLEGIKQEVSSKQEAIDNIAKKLNDYKTNVSNKFNEVDKAHNNLEETMNGAFKDGILTEAEKKDLEKQLNILEIEKNNALKEVEALMKIEELKDTNQLLLLNSSKQNFIDKHYSLINAIREVIGLNQEEKPQIPNISIFKDIVLHFPHFSDKHKPAYPDISLIENHNGDVYLFDGGEKISQYDVEKYLHSKNIFKIDKIFITHSHSDHISGIPYLIDKFGCKELYCKTPNWNSMPPIEINEWKTKELHEKMIAKARSIGAKIIELNSDRKIQLTNKSDIWVYNTQNNNYSNYNNISLGFLFRYYYNSKDAVRYFIQGDMSYSSEYFVGGKNVGKVDILKMGHHGNTSSNGETWLGYLRPDYSVATIAYPPGNQVRLNTMRAKFVSSKVFLPNDNADYMSVVINKDNGSIFTSAIEHVISNSWYQRDNGDWFYFKQDGSFATNESLIINERKYYFDTDSKCTNPEGENIE